MPTKKVLFLDMDGVLADFDSAARILFKDYDIPHTEYEDKYGSNAFWSIINTDPYFFRNLKPMPDIWELYDAVEHLKPAILTGVPKDMMGVPEDAFSSVTGKENQKVEWAREIFKDREYCPRVICCRASKKSAYCEPGNVLVDDRLQYAKKWEKTGGIFIHHKSAKESIEALKRINML